MNLSEIKLLYTKPNVLGGTLYLCGGQRNGDPFQKESDVGIPEWMSAEELFQSNLVPNCKIALYTYLLQEEPGIIFQLHSSIVSDKEFVEHLGNEAKDLYEMIINE
ncbi:MAG: hypothetical protein ABIA78_03405 [archaeon]